MRTFINWEHTRVMMMFLRPLSCTFAGQGNEVSHSLGLWIDRLGEQGQRRAWKYNGGVWLRLVDGQD